MSEAFIGEIRMFAGNFAPRNWAFCDGQLLAVSGSSGTHEKTHYRAFGGAPKHS